MILRNGSYTFPVKVPREKENHKERIIHPYAKNLRPA